MLNANQFVTRRDLAIIRMVYQYRGCAIDHVHRRFFPTSGARTPCYRRIAHLVRRGFLTSTRLPSFTGIGSGKTFLTIGPNAKPLLAEMLGLSRAEVTRTRRDSPWFIAHHLALCDIRLAFELAADRSDIFDVADWIGDRELHQSPLRLTDSKTFTDMTIVPDSLFILALPDGTKQHVILEIDMGTVALGRLRAKLRGYLLAVKGPIPVLFVVPGPSRQAQIARYAQEEAHDLDRDSTIFFLTTREAITSDTALSSPIWQVVGAEEPVSLEGLVMEKDSFPGAAVPRSPVRVP